MCRERKKDGVLDSDPHREGGQDAMPWVRALTRGWGGGCTFLTSVQGRTPSTSSKPLKHLLSSATPAFQSLIETLFFTSTFSQCLF